MTSWLCLVHGRLQVGRLRRTVEQPDLAAGHRVHRAGIPPAVYRRPASAPSSSRKRSPELRARPQVAVRQRYCRSQHRVLLHRLHEPAGQHVRRRARLQRQQCRRGQGPGRRARCALGDARQPRAAGRWSGPISSTRTTSASATPARRRTLRTGSTATTPARPTSTCRSSPATGARLRHARRRHASLRQHLELVYSDEYYPQATLDPTHVQDAFAKVNLGCRSARRTGPGNWRCSAAT